MPSVGLWEDPNWVYEYHVSALDGEMRNSRSLHRVTASAWFQVQRQGEAVSWAMD